MQSIIFDDGIKEYDINGDESRVIRINISDFNLLKRRDEAVKNIEALVRDMKADGTPTPEKLTEYDRRFREQINYIFGSDVCTPAFGSAHCMSIVSGGKMLFEGFLDALLRQVEQDMGETQSGFKLRLESIDRAKVNKYIN